MTEGSTRPHGDLPEGSTFDSLLDEVDTAVEPLVEGAAVGPAVGIASAGGSLISLPVDADLPGSPASGDSVRGGLLQAGPVALAGMVVNGAAALVVVVVARLVTSRSYGEIAQILGLFFILSMPGSAVLVGVVRRVSGMRADGQRDRVPMWVARIHRICLVGLGIELVVVLVTQAWIARMLGLPDGRGVVLILLAAGVWIMLSVDRGVLQANRRYRGLAGNLLVEGGVRTVLVMALVAGGLGVAGYALGVLVSEVVATLQARWLAARVPREGDADDVATAGTGAAAQTEPALARRRLLGDVGAAFVGLALLGLLQNVDVLILGRLDHGASGSYAAISVASKALVFGALALGAYLLPEATIRWNQGGHAIRQMLVTLLFLSVPAAVLLLISVAVPRQFLTLVFSARLATAAPAFSSLVLAMAFLSFTVLTTNYLFGTGSRWIVLLLAGGGIGAVSLISAAGGEAYATARADLLVQGLLALAMAGAFIGVHLRHRGQHWSRRLGWTARRAKPLPAG